MITREFKLYLNAGVGVAPVINANQFDQDEEWIFTLLQSDGTVYTPSTGAIIGLKQDGTTILNAGTVNSDGQVVITETEQMTAVPGSNLFELMIDGNTHGTANFVVFVERRPGDIDNPSESDISLFQEAITAAGNVTQFQADIANLKQDVDDLEEADTNLASQIAQETSARTQQDAVLQAEIDQIIAPTGEAPSAAEVQNARIGVDGTTYDTLGNAIRGQVGDLKNAIDPLIGKESIDLSSIANNGHYINHAGAINNTSGKYCYSNPIPVYVGKEYTFKGVGTTIMSGMCTCDFEGNKRTSIFDYESTDIEETFSYTPTADGYILVCYNYAKPYSLYRKESVTISEIKTALNEISEADNLIDFSQLQLGVNWTGATASNRAVVYLPVEPNTDYFVSNKNNPSNFSITIVEKSINNGSGSSLGSFGVNSEASQTFTTGASTKYICVQFNGSSTITESDFDGYGIYLCKGTKTKLVAIDDVARRNLDNTHDTFRELAESMNIGIQRVGGYEVRPITNPLEVVRHKEDAIDTPYYDVNSIARQYETTNYHKSVDTKNILNALESEEIDFTPSNNGFTRIVVGKNSDDLFFVSYVASNRVGSFGNPAYDALEVTSDFVNFRTILRSDALSSGDGIPLPNMTNIKVDLVKQFANGEYILAIRCHNISENNDYTHFYRMSADFTQIIHCNYTNFSGNSVPMIDEFSSTVYDWSVFVNGNKAIATTYGNRQPETDYGRVWFTENGGKYWKQVFQTNNHYQDGQAEGVTVAKTHTHGVMLENINDQVTRLFVLAGEDNRNIFWTDAGMNATDDSWNVIDICNQPFYDFQSFTQVVNGYPFKDGLIFGSDNADVGCIYRINKLDDGSYSRIESVHEILPNKFNSTSYCAAEMYRRDYNTPLLMCFTKENARYTEADNELLNQYHKARVVATYDGFNFTEIWTDDTYGEHDAYINGETVKRYYSYCTRGMNCYLLKNGDAVIKYAGRDYYYFGGNPLFSVTGLSNGSCKVKVIKNAEKYL